MNARWTALALLGGALGVLTGCGGQGDSASAPMTLSTSAGDGRAVLSYGAESGVEYWVFLASYADFNRGNPEDILTDIDQPQTICGLRNGTTYWMAINGRKDGGEGGELSDKVSVTPRPAGDSWSGVSLPGGSGSINGLAYVNLENCRTIDSDYTRSGTGYYFALGNNGTLLQSYDGSSWSGASLPSGFTGNLRAASGYTKYPSEDNLDDKSPLWIAVGDNGVAVYTDDGSSWTQGRAADASLPTLRSVANAAYDFIAVGDAGTIIYTNSGKSWASRSSGVSTALNAVTYGSGMFVAAGANGVLLVSDDGGDSWDPVSTGTTATLNAVSYGNFNYSTDLDDDAIQIDTFVAVGNGGSILVSQDGGDSWKAVSSGISADLVAVSYTTRFIALDSAGNAYTSTDGLTWSSAIATGSTGITKSVTNGGSVLALGSGNMTRAD